MHKRFAQNIEDLRRLIDGSASASIISDSLSSDGLHYLLAVSGGMDSMCMADLFLQTLGPSSFAIAHCNFSLRGHESDGDEALVREWAGKNGVKIFVKRFDTVGFARERGVSIEMAARELRYEWFAQLCASYGFDVLSVAHNANDNAETLMLNLLRGTGLKGLRGIEKLSCYKSRTDCGLHWPPPSYRCAPPPTRGCENANSGHQSAPTLIIMRPLLDCTRKQIEGYVFSHKVPYRHDSSNFESDYKRNRIRNEVFPVFEKINPSFIRTINREMGYFSEAGEIVEDWCRRHIDEVVSVRDDATVINTSVLLTTAHWRYLLYYILEPFGFSSQVLSSLEELLTSDRTIPGKRFDSSSHSLVTGRDSLKVIPVSVSADDEIMVVRGAGIYNYNGARFSVEVVDWDGSGSLKQPQGILVMDADRMRFPFVCRRWRQGDWLIPLGMRGKKKVSDLFTDLKYDSLDKDRAIIMVDTLSEGLAEQQHIAGLLGVRIDDRYKVTPSTRTLLRITVL